MADRNPMDSAHREDLDGSLWESPAKQSRNSKEPSGATRKGGETRPSYEDEESRDAALRRELASVRKVNEAIEGVVQNLERAKTNMKTVNLTVGAASTLLDTWTRILSQTEHNQRLILDPSWQGASQDIADIEADAHAKQQAAQRREAEEQERKAAAVRKAEEDERKRAAQPTAQKSTLRTRGRASSRAASTTARPPSSGHGMTDTSTSSIARGAYSSRRGTSGIGRGTRGGRTRA